MKQVLVGIGLLFFFQLKSQVVIDSCFSSIDAYHLDNDNLNSYSPRSDYIFGSFFGMVEWQNGKWQYLRKFKNQETPIFIKDISILSTFEMNTRLFYLGNAAHMEKKRKGWAEYFALKLDKPLMVGETYSYTFTYISTSHPADRSLFSPHIRTNKKGNLKNSEYVGDLKPVLYQWETNTITFTATKKQKGHTWLIIDATAPEIEGQNGAVLDMCTKLPPKELVLLPNKDSVIANRTNFENLTKGTSIVLQNVFFETGESKLKEASFIELDEIVKTLQSNPDLIIEIQGHTDNIGTASINLELSENRANAVLTYLVSQGIPNKQLTAKGYGATNPIATNETEEGKAKNRRVESKVLEKYTETK